MFFFTAPKQVSATEALPGRDVAQLDADSFIHRIFGEPLSAHDDDVAAGRAQQAFFALGCFWGAEKLFWSQPGIISTSVGYQGGFTANPTYREVCSGNTGHAETVRVVFNPDQTSYEQLLSVFFENHDPTQGFRQGNDVGTQYRSALFVTDDAQHASASQLAQQFQDQLTKAGFATITTEISAAGPFFYAEDYHQQYLDANPGGYCPIHATGVKCGPAT